MTEPLFDVVIFAYETGIIESIVGKDLPRKHEHRTHHHDEAETRATTVLGRCNDRYGVAIVVAGARTKGDILQPGDNVW